MMAMTFPRELQMAAALSRAPLGFVESSNRFDLPEVAKLFVCFLEVFEQAGTVVVKRPSP